jgi:protocatechuate 3,4-dioxygenase, beta subunit
MYIQSTSTSKERQYRRPLFSACLTLFCSMAIQVLVLSACQGQATRENQAQKRPATVGGAFENREFVYYGIPRIMSAVDTSPGWTQNGQKIRVAGTIYLADGKTPAPDVLLYYYQTNTAGRYEHRPGEARSMPPNDKGQTHGYIRGWVKTDARGRYTIYTVRPGTYPTRDEPAHIHATIKEPNEINEYYIDDFVFDDDLLLTSEKRRKMEKRCGSGILSLAQKEGLLTGERNIILGLNIPGYLVK